MKIIVSKEEVKEVHAIIDSILKSSGIQALQLANKLANSIELLPEEAQEGKE